jgi:hypothetical protein
VGGVTGAGDAGDGGGGVPDGGGADAGAGGARGKAEADPSPRPLPIPTPNRGGGNFGAGGDPGQPRGWACSAADAGVPPAVTVATSFLLALLLAGRRRR